MFITLKFFTLFRAIWRYCNDSDFDSHNISDEILLVIMLVMMEMMLLILITYDERRGSHLFLRWIPHIFLRWAPHLFLRRGPHIHTSSSGHYHCCWIIHFEKQMCFLIHISLIIIQFYSLLFLHWVMKALLIKKAII